MFRFQGCSTLCEAELLFRFRCRPPRKQEPKRRGFLDSPSRAMTIEPSLRAQAKQSMARQSKYGLLRRYRSS
jgi:hypothetical protein